MNYGHDKHIFAKKHSKNHCLYIAIVIETKCQLKIQTKGKKFLLALIKSGYES